MNPAGSVPAAADQAGGRLKHLYEISKLFASFENVQQTLVPALAVVNATLLLRSAILIEEEEGRLKVTSWPAEGLDPEDLRIARQHVEKVFNYLSGATPARVVKLSEQGGVIAAPREAGAEEAHAKRFIVIPLVVARR